MTYAPALTPGDLFAFSAQDATEWLVVETSRYSNGDVIVHANGPAPGFLATFTLAPAAVVDLR